LFANTSNLRGYVQHLTLPEAYGLELAPTFDGVSMFWYDDLDSQRELPEDPELAPLLHAVLAVAFEAAPPASAEQVSGEESKAAALLRAVLEDDAQLFDRSTAWPAHRRTALVVAQEQVVVDGVAAPEMVKVIVIASKKPGLTLDQFFDYWLNRHGLLVSRLPGLRRYVQNHGLPEAYADRGQTHDGWSELWFDDLAAVVRVVGTAEWRALQDDAAMLFAEPVGVGIARERVQKDRGWVYNDWGVGALGEGAISARLAEQGYAGLAADPGTPRRLKAAAAEQALAVWTDEHLVTIDNSRIDARPG
jgi:uncharacterized protein (TIGR02118 family)